MTEATPTPSPPTTRQTMRSQTPKARPEPTALTVNRTAAATMTFGRPKRSAAEPANHAPTTQPSSAHDTAKPVSPALRSNVGAERVDGAVDDGGVEAEQEPADGGDDRDEDGVAGVVAALPGALLAPGARRARAPPGRRRARRPGPRPRPAAALPGHGHRPLRRGRDDGRGPGPRDRPIGPSGDRTRTGPRAARPRAYARADERPAVRPAARVGRPGPRRTTAPADRRVVGRVAGDGAARPDAGRRGVRRGGPGPDGRRPSSRPGPRGGGPRRVVLVLLGQVALVVALGPELVAGAREGYRRRARRGRGARRRARGRTGQDGPARRGRTARGPTGPTRPSRGRTRPGRRSWRSTTSRSATASTTRSPRLLRDHGAALRRPPRRRGRHPGHARGRPLPGGHRGGRPGLGHVHGRSSPTCSTPRASTPPASTSGPSPRPRSRGC